MYSLHAMRGACWVRAGRVRRRGVARFRVDQFRDAVDAFFSAAVDQQCHWSSRELGCPPGWRSVVLGRVCMVASEKAWTAVVAPRLPAG
jgi:hypothetical protein